MRLQSKKPGLPFCGTPRKIGAMKQTLPLALALFLAACGVQGTDFPAIGVGAETPAAEAEDTCGASAFAYLVGSPRGILDTVDFPDGTRILPPDSMATMDFKPDRLNVAIDGNAEVERVYCG